MINLLRKTWWKYMAVVLLLYVIIGGMLVPLGPGITRISPATFPSDSSVEFVLNGFNTHFKDGGDLQLWFKNGTDFYCADKVTAIDNATLKATFSFPQNSLKKLSGKNFDVVINDDQDATISMRDGVTVSAGQADSAALAAAGKATCPNEAKVLKSAQFTFPYREILYQSIRNTFFHVPMWMAMTLILIFATVYSILYLASGKIEHDILASQAVNVAVMFGLLGLSTGSVWARFTWGSFWPNDWKLHGAAVGVMIYLAYIVLRGSLDDEIKRARISAAYSIFAVVIFALFIFIIPRLTDSLHPGNGGNPAFSKYDLDSHLRLFFYPAVIGWSMLGGWIWSISVRIKLLELKNSKA